LSYSETPSLFLQPVTMKLSQTYLAGPSVFSRFVLGLLFSMRPVACGRGTLFARVTPFFAGVPIFLTEGPRLSRHSFGASFPFSNRPAKNDFPLRILSSREFPPFPTFFPSLLTFLPPFYAAIPSSKQFAPEESLALSFLGFPLYRTNRFPVISEPSFSLRVFPAQLSKTPHGGIFFVPFRSLSYAFFRPSRRVFLVSLE